LWLFSLTSSIDDDSLLKGVPIPGAPEGKSLHDLLSEGRATWQESNRKFLEQQLSEVEDRESNL
jgi:hypothetical protein